MSEHEITSIQISRTDLTWLLEEYPDARSKAQALEWAIRDLRIIMGGMSHGKK